jgi:D-glycero-alpha-D-manno-heptose-7-phosphate kinase
MIVVRTPLRVSFFGGGTDHPAWFSRPEPGAVLSTTIDKYIYVQLRRLPALFEFNYRVAWGVLEEVKTINEIQHPVVREMLRHYAEDIDHASGYEVIYNADLPSKTGLGSSSAFTVSLLNAYLGNREKLCSKPFLAREAIHLEQDILQETVGCQDQIAAAYGGFNRIDFQSDGQFSVTQIRISAARREQLEESLMLFFTGFTRSANQIEKQKVARYPDKTEQLRAIYNMVDEGERILLDSRRPISEFGELLHHAWSEKRQLDESVSNPFIDESYEAGRAAGALGGKLLGAGGGGFLLMFVPPTKHEAVKAAMAKLPFVPFRFERQGSSVVLYDPDLDSNYQTAKARVE